MSHGVRAGAANSHSASAMSKAESRPAAKKLGAKRLLRHNPAQRYNIYEAA